MRKLTTWAGSETVAKAIDLVDDDHNDQITGLICSNKATNADLQGPDGA